MKKLDEKDVLVEFENFDKDKFSLILSTTSLDNTPHTNYSPFVKKDESYYICVSKNLQHFQNIEQTKKAHVLIIEDEAKASHIYARKRLYFSVVCELVENEEEIFRLFDERYGDKLSFLRDMKDFKVVKLIAKEKSLVLGFGAAYVMGIDGKLSNKTISHK